MTCMYHLLAVGFFKSKEKQFWSRLFAQEYTTHLAFKLYNEALREAISAEEIMA